MDWKSELDVCLASPTLLKCVRGFMVWQDASLPSDHAPIAVSVSPPNVDMAALYASAKCLGDHATLYTRGHNSSVRKAFRISNINVNRFKHQLSCREVPILIDLDDINAYADAITDTLYSCSKECYQKERGPPVSPVMERWDRIMRDDDDGRVWRAIDWKGQDSEGNGNKICPDDKQFQLFFENMFNPPEVPPINCDMISTHVEIPLLDSEITREEVQMCINKLRADKASGPDGICPGIFKVLPIQWLLCITSLFNVVFASNFYPSSWRLARLFTIFKRGDRLLPSNYRGINVINSISKIYDMILCNRLTQWFTPFREQAGSQSKRGCLEHIITLRLLIDLAKRKKFTLFVTFVDFTQAYDRVPRATLFRVLQRLGCGAVMLAALVAMYHATQSVLGTAIITATVGVRQGSPTSCILFVLFIDDLIRLLKEKCGRDGFLSWLHVLVLMDDTVLLSTSRAGMSKKISILLEFCNDYGMKVNMSKTKFFGINVGPREREPFHVHGVTVQWCDRYTYLGSVFTSEGSLSSAIAAHAQVKMCHILKFISYVKKNVDTPFYVKKRLFHAALMSSVLYGCESWLGGSLKPIEKLYNWGIKQLLGVRMSTCNEICYLELGMPPVKAIVAQKQRKYFRNMWSERRAMDDDPWTHVVRLVLESDTLTSRRVFDLIHRDADDFGEAMAAVKLSVRSSNSSRRATYALLNPSFSVHDVYLQRKFINDVFRGSFSKLRVSGHSLAVETGRWNMRGRGRLPLEERLCPCGAVQTELHVVESCPQTLSLRDQYQFNSWQELMAKDVDETIKIVHIILSMYH